eukprot:XP_011664392.1 PREDICTED: uncharacterized protein LOC105438368 [Strongylocentrotus purpuratus]
MTGRIRNLLRRNDYDEGTRRTPWYRCLVALATLFVFASMVAVVALVHLAKQLVSINSKIERIIADVEKTRQNVVNLVVFFEQLNYELNQQLAVYTVESLLGSVGGLLGLYLGLSFMSIGEIIVLLLGFLKIFGGKTLCSSCRSKSEADDKYSDRSKSQSTQKASDMNDYDEGTRRAPWYRSLVALATLFVFASMVVVVALVMLFELGVISINL